MFAAITAKPIALARPRGAGRTARRQNQPAAVRCQVQNDGVAKSAKSTSASASEDYSCLSVSSSRRDALMAMTLAPAIFLNPDVAHAVVSKAAATPDERCALKTLVPYDISPFPKVPKFHLLPF